MNEQEKTSKLEEIMRNPELIASIAAAADTKARMALFENYGLSLSEAEVDTFTKLMDSADDLEMRETDLEAVSGGGGAVSSWITKKALDFAWSSLVKSCKAAWQTGRMAAGR